MAIAVMFPGQGAQSSGMGVVWQDHPAWSVVQRAEDALGHPVAPLLIDDPLERTGDAQMAVLLTSLMAWEDAKAGLGDVMAMAGHSLGQVTALIAAGALEFEDGIRLAAHRAAATQKAADDRPGRMAALLGASDEQLDAALAAAPDECWLANDNAPGQAVIAGTEAGLARATDAARAAGVRKIMPLAVGGAFHTPLMDEARWLLHAYLAGVPIHRPRVPVIANADATAYDDDEGWRARLATHVVEPVRWRQSVETMAAMGATRLVEVGPGNALTAMAKRIAPDLIQPNGASS